jgi:Putative restriction endonuclease
MLFFSLMAPMFDHGSTVVTTDVTGGASFHPVEHIGIRSSRSPTKTAKPLEKSFPRIDDHLIKPEVSQFELIRGREVDVSGSDPPHADAQSRLSFLILAHVVGGFIVASELLTRMAEKSNFATDVCIRKDGIDPETNTRYLEEIAFEIVNTQRKRNVTEKADDMAIRGVRRVFAVFLKAGQVAEWSAEQRKFIPLEKEALIHDPVFVRPVPVQAILDQTLGEDEAAQALITKRNRAIVKHERDVETKGRKKGLAEGRKQGRVEGHKQGIDQGLEVGRQLLLGMIQMRFGEVPAAIKRKIEAANAVALQAWGQKALAGASLHDVFAT